MIPVTNVRDFYIILYDVVYVGYASRYNANSWINQTIYSNNSNPLSVQIITNKVYQFISVTTGSLEGETLKYEYL